MDNQAANVCLIAHVLQLQDYGRQNPLMQVDFSRLYNFIRQQ